MSFLDQIEPLKQSALAELRAAADSSALEQARVAYLGANGKLTALMKQLGTLSKEEKPAAGKLINAAKAEIEAALAERRAELELTRLSPQRASGFHAARPPTRARQTPSVDPGDRGHRPQFPQDRFRGRRRAGSRRRISLFRRAEHARRSSGPRHPGHILPRKPARPRTSAKFSARRLDTPPSFAPTLPRFRSG